MIDVGKYQEKVDELRIKNPDFPGMDKLLDGYNVVNAIVLQWALSGHLDHLRASVSDVPVTTAAEDRKNVEQSDIYRQLGHDKRALYQWRAKLSNEFHTCRTDEHRAELSTQIQAVQAKIEGLQKHMRDVRYQKISEDDARQMYNEDSVDANLRQIKRLNGVDLSKKLNSIRARVSQTKRKLQTLAKSPVPDKASIEKYERILRELKIQKEYAERKVQKATRAPRL